MQAAAACAGCTTEDKHVLKLLRTILDIYGRSNNKNDLQSFAEACMRLENCVGSRGLGQLTFSGIQAFLNSDRKFETLDELLEWFCSEHPGCVRCVNKDCQKDKTDLRSTSDMFFSQLQHANIELAAAQALLQETQAVLQQLCEDIEGKNIELAAAQAELLQAQADIEGKNIELLRHKDVDTIMQLGEIQDMKPGIRAALKAKLIELKVWVFA